MLGEFAVIALAQILFQTLDVFSEKSCVRSVADPANVRVCSPDSSLQLTILHVSLLPLPDCSSRGHHLIDLCICMSVSHPFPPRQPALSQRCNQVVTVCTRSECVRRQ